MILIFVFFSGKVKLSPFTSWRKMKLVSTLTSSSAWGEIQDDVDLDVASEFVCRMYAQMKTNNVNEARYNKLMQMTGKVDQVIYIKSCLFNYFLT